jgi:hypothetical protein
MAASEDPIVRGRLDDSKPLTRRQRRRYDRLRRKEQFRWNGKPRFPTEA